MNDNRGNDASKALKVIAFIIVFMLYGFWALMQYAVNNHLISEFAAFCMMLSWIVGFTILVVWCFNSYINKSDHKDTKDMIDVARLQSENLKALEQEQRIRNAMVKNDIEVMRALSAKNVEVIKSDNDFYPNTEDVERALANVRDVADKFPLN